jgi:hypothetical protein
MLAGFYYVNDADEIWRIHASSDRHALVQQLGHENLDEFEVIEMSDLLEVAVYRSPDAAKAAIEQRAA